MSLQNLTRFPRLELNGAPTPLENLPRRSHPVEPCPSDGSGGGKTWPALRGAAGKPNGYPG